MCSGLGVLQAQGCYVTDNGSVPTTSPPPHTHWAQPHYTIHSAPQQPFWTGPAPSGLSWTLTILSIFTPPTSTPFNAMRCIIAKLGICDDALIGIEKDNIAGLIRHKQSHGLLMGYKSWIKWRVVHPPLLRPSWRSSSPAPPGRWPPVAPPASLHTCRGSRSIHDA